jgi:LacI family repressor for deo operon, udp, cdd, tsx, nupC, and nupG
MADVARLAEVSTAAVSYYLSDRKEHLSRVGPDARERIRAAIEQLGYVQNKTARHLRRQRTERICIMLPRLGIPFADKMTQDIEAVAERHGILSIVLTGHDKAAYRRILSEVEAGLADGVIADADGLTEEEVAEVFEPFARLNKACLVMHATAAPGSYSVLNHDRTVALMRVVAYLREKGHQNLVYVQNRTMISNPRVVALDELVQLVGSPLTVAFMDGAQARESAAARAREIAAMPDHPTAVLVESDFTAVTMVEEFVRLGLSVPADIAVVGCGNAEEGYYCNPRLTTIGPEWLSLTEASEHLMDVIEGRSGVATRRFTVPWTLFARESA